MKSSRKKYTIYAELAPHGLEDWDKIGQFLREMVAEEPPPAKKGTLRKYLIEKSFPKWEADYILASFPPSLDCQTRKQEKSK